MPTLKSARRVPGMHRLRRLCAVAAVVVVGGSLVSTPAQAAPRYTHPSTLTRDCMIHANYPKPGVPDWGWTKPARSPRGGAYHVGVRYTVNDSYAMVLDYDRGNRRPKVNPHWGFMARSCLTDPHAYHGNTRLGHLRGVGGNGQPKDVPFAPSPGGRGKTVQVNSYGTLRSAANSFPIGNVRDVDTFRITTSTCGRHHPEAWLFGYAPNSGRWGWVQATHLSGCT
jgi:hypothetical protein